MKKPGINFNLMDQLVFYGSYHQHPGNQLIHFVFVPLIMWSVGVWLAYTGPVSDKLDLPGLLRNFLPPILADGYVVNATFIMSALYGLYYTILEPFAGLSWCAILGLPLLWSCHAFQEYIPYAWAYAIAAHFIGWFMQIKVGHIMIEQKRPALLDSFFQSLILAGLFAWIEGLFYLGYRPGLQKELKRRIQEAEAMPEPAATKQPLLSQAAA